MYMLQTRVEAYIMICNNAAILMSTRIAYIKTKYVLTNNYEL